MITWRNKAIEQLSPAELRQALEDAADMIIAAEQRQNPEQLMTSLLSGFVAGAATATLALVIPRLLH